MLPGETFSADDARHLDVDERARRAALAKATTKCHFLRRRASFHAAPLVSREKLHTSSTMTNIDDAARLTLSMMRRLLRRLLLSLADTRGTISTDAHIFPHAHHFPRAED